MTTVFLMLLLASKAVEEWDFSTTLCQCPITSSVDVEKNVSWPSDCLISGLQIHRVFLKPIASTAAPDAGPSPSGKQQLAGRPVLMFWELSV